MLKRITSLADLLFRITQDKRYEYLSVVGYQKAMGRSIKLLGNDFFENKENIKTSLDWAVNWRKSASQENCWVVVEHINLFRGEIETRYPHPVPPT